MWDRRERERKSGRLSRSEDMRCRRQKDRKVRGAREGTVTYGHF